MSRTNRSGTTEVSIEDRIREIQSNTANGGASGRVRISYLSPAEGFQASVYPSYQQARAKAEAAYAQGTTGVTRAALEYDTERHELTPLFVAFGDTIAEALAALQKLTIPLIAA